MTQRSSFFSILFNELYVSIYILYLNHRPNFLFWLETSGKNNIRVWWSFFYYTLHMQKDSSFGVVPTFFDGQTYWFLLVCLRGGNHWWFPKWHAEKNESDTVAARRELHEETWIADVRLVSACSFVETYTFPHDTVWIDKTVVYFLWFVDTKVPPIIQEKEILAAQRLPYTEALETLTYASTKKVLDAAWKYLHNPIK